MGGISRPTQQINAMRLYMLVAILQVLFKFVLKLCVTLGFIFMVACTVFVVVCAIRGDIKINITKSESEKEEK